MAKMRSPECFAYITAKQGNPDYCGALKKLNCENCSFFATRAQANAKRQKANIRRKKIKAPLWDPITAELTVCEED